MADRALRLLIVAHDMDLRGGIPCAAAGLCHAMSARGHEVILLTHASSRRLAYDIGERTALCFYAFSDKNSEIQKMRVRIKALAADLCIAMFCGGPHLVWAATLMGTGIPFVLSEHCDPHSVETAGWWSQAGRHAGMSGADMIHLLLPQYVQSVPDFLRHRVRVIPNALHFPHQTAQAAGEGKERLRLLWLGRLDDEIKQCCMALDAFALLAAQFTQWDMHVVGEGRDEARIHAHAATLGLEQRIFFHGNAHDPWPWYLDAQLFCMSSKAEGFGLTTAEALCCGLPVVGFAACPGTAHLVRHGENGLLAKTMTAAGLAEPLAGLMGDAALRRRMGLQALSLREAWRADTIYDQWEHLCVETAASKGATIMDAFAEEPFASKARLSAAVRRDYLYRDFGMPMPTY